MKLLSKRFSLLPDQVHRNDLPEPQLLEDHFDNFINKSQVFPKGFPRVFRLNSRLGSIEKCTNTQ